MLRLPVIGTNETFEIAPSKIIAVGLNYREHVAETPSILADSPVDPAAAGNLPSEPILFPKTPNVLVATGDCIVIPSTFIARYGFDQPRTDFEAELAIIIGRRCREVPAKDARDFIFGYTCFNDISQRNIQNADRSGWFRGKSFDTFGPIGPAILREGPGFDPQALAIECRLNGRVVQKSSTAAMIFGIAELVAFISRNMTLEPGDIIASGTPSGVGALKSGDLVEVEIEGIGILRNPVVES